MSRREFHFQDGSSQKFWAIDLDGLSFTVQFGKSGTAGQAQTKQFGSEAEAKSAADKLIAEKTKKGYAEVGTTGETASTPAKPAKPKKSPSPTGSPPPQTVPPPLPTAPAPLAVTNTIDLAPTDWYMASWRKLPPLPHEKTEPASFDRASCLERLEQMGTNRYNHWDWGRLDHADVLEPAEARFWLHVYAGLNGRGDRDLKAKLTKKLSKEDLDGSLSVEEILEYTQTPQCLGPIERMLAIARHQLTTAEFLRLLRNERLLFEGYHWHAPTIIRWFMASVLPYLTRAELDALQIELRKELTNGKWPQPQQPTHPTPAWYFAGPAGLYDELLALVRSWPDGSFGPKGVLRMTSYHNEPQLVLFGLGSQLVLQEGRRTGMTFEDPIHSRGWLACTERAGLDCLADAISNQPNRDGAQRLFEVLALVNSPDTTPQMLALKLNSKVQKSANDWLEANTANAIAGLVPVAAGKGKLADAALEYLREAKKKGHSAFLAEQITHAPADVAAKIRADILDREEKIYAPFDAKTTPAWLKQALSTAPMPGKPTSLSDPIRLPPLLVEGRRLSDDQVPVVIAALKASPLGSAQPLFAALKEHADRVSLDAFAWRLFELWLGEGAPSKEKWAFTVLGHLGGDASVLKLTPLVRAWPGESQHQRAVVGLECLRAIGSDTALMQLNGIAQKLKFQGLKNKAKEFMEAIAHDKGLTREELEDRIVPDLDLDERGSRVFDYGPRQFRVVLGPDLTPLVRDDSGKSKGDLPKPGAKDDADKANTAVADWKLLKQLREVLKVQAPRLEQAMVTGRRWPVEQFEMLLVRHPLMTNLARRLLWGGYDAKGKLVVTFRVTEELEYADASDKACELKGVATVGILHPLVLTEAQRSAWGQVFGDYEIIAPFEQLGRPVHALEAAEASGKTINRLGKKKVPGLTVRSTLEKLGWLRGNPSDHGVVQEFTKVFPGGNVTAVIGVEPGIPMGLPDWTEDQTIERVFFFPGVYTSLCYPYHKEETFVPLKEVDAVAVSEVLTDLGTLASKAK